MRIVRHRIGTGLLVVRPDDPHEDTIVVVNPDYSRAQVARLAPSVLRAGEITEVFAYLDGQHHPGHLSRRGVLAEGSAANDPALGAAGRTPPD